ncbi:MAG: protoporphyrinogen oxidase [Opitutaceae bacterium]|nr:protoporphyrinogen oxidase [Opitutaceae bacterium]
MCESDSAACASSQNSSRLPPVAVIGGGITGLVAAWRLSRAGRGVRLFEASSRMGGAIRTLHERDGWMPEAGPNTLLVKTREFHALIDDLGLAARLMQANPGAAKRFLIRGGRIRAVPQSPVGALVTPLLSPPAKLRIAAEVLFASRRERAEDLSLADFAREHYGREFVDYALNPLVAGIYAGDPEKLSARLSFPFLWQAERTHGSLIRGQVAQMRARLRQGGPKAALISFAGGVQTLTDTLAAALPDGVAALDAPVKSLTPVSGAPPVPGARTSASEARWRIRWQDALRGGGGAREEIFSSVVLALPAAALARLEIAGARPLAPLAAVDYPPVASLFVGYRRGQIAHPLDGFGVLAPERERRRFLGVLFSSSLFPGRAPDGCAALTVMVGGTRQPRLARLPSDELMREVLPDVSRLLGIRGGPVFTHHQLAERAIPQYNLGYERHLAVVEACESAHSGLHIGGHVRDGISVPACVASGERLAARVLGEA